MKDTVKIAMPKTPGERLSITSPAQRKKLAKAAELLLEAFAWGDAEEGNEFWESVHDRMHQIVERGF